MKNKVELHQKKSGRLQFTLRKILHTGKTMQQYTQVNYNGYETIVEK
jgi:SPX domain protein involved in polyphosphate accumulation